MGRNKQWGKKAWKKGEQKVEAEQDISTLFSVDRSGKLNAKNRNRLGALKSRKRVDNSFSIENVSERAIEEVKQKKNEKSKIADPWAIDSKNEPMKVFNSNNLGHTRKNKAPKAKHIIEGHMIVPEEGTSYNPDKKARREILNKALKHICKEKLKQAHQEPMHIAGNLEKIKNESNLVDQIMKLEAITAKRATKVSWNGQDSEDIIQEFLGISDSEPESEAEEKAGEETTEIIKNKIPERLTQRQKNRKRRRHEQSRNIKLKLRKKQKREELEKLSAIKDEVYAEKPKIEKKVNLHPRLASLKYKVQFPAVSLENELKSLKDVVPVGNLTKDLYNNMQRRNKLEVRKKGERRLQNRHPKFKVQTVVGSRKGAVVHTKYEY